MEWSCAAWKLLVKPRILVSRPTLRMHRVNLVIVLSSYWSWFWSSLDVCGLGAEIDGMWFVAVSAGIVQRHSGQHDASWAETARGYFVFFPLIDHQNIVLKLLYKDMCIAETHKHMVVHYRHIFSTPLHSRLGQFPKIMINWWLYLKKSNEINLFIQP